MKTIGVDSANVIYDEPRVNVMNRGLTKREYFAAMAMQGYLASFSGEGLATPSTMAMRAIGYADALINELNKE